MYDAIYRCSRDNNDFIFRHEERLSFAEAMWIYTRNGAFSSNCENDLGSIQESFGADFVILDPEVISNPILLKDMETDLVVVGGQIAHTGRFFLDGGPLDEPIVVCQLSGPFIPGKNGGANWMSEWKCRCCYLR